MCLWAGLIDSALLVRFRKLELDEMLTVFSLSEDTILLLAKIVFESFALIMRLS